jgi:rubrerythrin
MRIVSKGTAVLVLAAMMVPGGAKQAWAAEAAAGTLKNLQEAFNGESNAHARYVEFAKKADEEGYGRVASLFRAAAQAEQIHAKAHAEVIRKLGGEPKADIQKVEPKSTRENLEAALKGETYEKETMYPDFIKVAKGEGVREAVKTFNMAKTAEAEHAKFYAAALQNLEGWKGKAKDFYVCTVCGYTMDKPPAEKCVSCFSPKEKYVTVG